MFLTLLRRARNPGPRAQITEDLNYHKDTRKSKRISPLGQSLASSKTLIGDNDCTTGNVC